MAFREFVRVIRLSTAALIAVASASAALAHPFSLTEGVVDVRRDGVEVSMRIMVEDFYLFQELEPDEEGYFSPALLEQALEDHKALLLRDFTVRNLEGDLLEGKVTDAALPEMGEKGVHLGSLMARFADYTIFYPTSDPAEYLTFMQAFGGEENYLPSNMALTFNREGEPMGYRATLYRDVPYTLRVDWDRPTYPLTASPEEQEEWVVQEEEETLGITSYGAVYSFIYVTDREVRHEVLIPLMSFEHWEVIPREDPAFITVEEQEAAKQIVEDAFVMNNIGVIDGVDVRPVADRIDFYGLDFKDFASQAPQQKLSAHTARIGVILRYPAKSAPEQVKLTWNMFNPYVPVLYSTVFAPNANQNHVFSPQRNEFTWEAEEAPEGPQFADVAPPMPAPRIQLPVVSIVAALAALGCGIAALGLRRGRKRIFAVALLFGIVAFGTLWYRPLAFDNPFREAPAPSASDAKVIVAALNQNIYRAFDYGDESAVYDALAQSVGGDYLSDLYVQIREGLAMQEQGGAIARVEQVNFQDGQLLTDSAGADGFRYAGTWEVIGTVEHWGHIHRRTNRYAAEFTVNAVDDRWKITDVDVTREERVKFETRLRRLGPQAAAS